MIFGLKPMRERENTFFTKDIYDSAIDLETNEDVLERIYLDVSSDACLSIEFFFVSDSKEKLKALGVSMMEQFPSYYGFKIGSYEDVFQLTGETSPIQMELESINAWNRIMCDLGYAFDCKLDGWQVQTKSSHS